MEIFKDIKGYEGLYQVSDLGRVKSLERTYINSNGIKKVNKDLVMAPQLAGFGYLFVRLRKNERYETKYIHKLILESFVSNIENKLQGNHKDGNKLNNSLENLEWCTYSENIKHAYNTELRTKDWCKSGVRKKTVVHLQTGIFYNSLKEGLNAHNIKRSTEATRIRRNLKNQNFNFI